MGFSGVRPTEVKVPGEQEYTKGAGRKSYSDLLMQGKNRVQDSRGGHYSEFDHRSLGARTEIDSSKGESPSTNNEGGRVGRNQPVASTGDSGLTADARVHGKGKSNTQVLPPIVSGPNAGPK